MLGFGARRPRLAARVKLPEVKVPEVPLPTRIEVPEVHVPSVQLGGGRVAGVQIPAVRTPEVRTPELELLARNGLRLRRKRANPIWVGLKFVVGLGLGLLVGTLVAALLAPAAGEDTRNKLKSMVPLGRSRDPSSAPAAQANGALDALKARFRHAVDEAKQTRIQRERELMAEYETAKRTGAAP